MRCLHKLLPALEVARGPKGKRLQRLAGARGACAKPTGRPLSPPRQLAAGLHIVVLARVTLPFLRSPLGVQQRLGPPWKSSLLLAARQSRPTIPAVEWPTAR